MPMTQSTQDQNNSNISNSVDDVSETNQSTEPQAAPVPSDDGHDDASFCQKIISMLDIGSWPDVIYHKDRDDYSSDYFDSRFVSSSEEDDSQARATIDAFNQFRSTVLTPQLLKEGFQPGRKYPIRRFADRVRLLEASMSTEQQPSPRPLRILVFGSSFTIGSNCGESTAQEANDCAWPGRLARRFNASFVEWNMYQENAQGSVNIAHKIPSIVNEFFDENTSPDAILLDNTIIDLGMNRPWFEAVVRAFIKHFPGTVLVSIVDAVSHFTDNPEGGDHSRWLYDVQTHYGLTVVNIGKMSRLQRHVNTSTYIQRSVVEEAKRIYREHPASGDNYDENNTILDLIWPQADHMKSGNGSVYYDSEANGGGEVYWSQFIPWTRKTKPANYPGNHPPWVTHQYVADAVMHGLLNLVTIGSECRADDDDYSFDETLESSVLEASVATMEEINAAFICEAPVTRIDAKSPPYVDRVIANLTSINNDTEIPSDGGDTVALVCGDWQWITDDRSRSGWQSNEYGSIIRFRLKVSTEKLPTISITYMRSYETFGNVRVTFHPVSRKDLKENPSPPPVFGCNDIHKFLTDENGTVAVPSLEMDGYQQQFTSWSTAVFPHQGDWSDLNSRPYHELLRDTVLSQMQKSEDESIVVDEDDAVEYVDLYVINTNTYRMRIKIQIVTSC